ncbi:MAG: hypothetical protein AB1656_19515 [Candidatus Omnitrophota bacterium]
MVRQAYINKRFNRASAATIEQVNVILDEYEQQGYDLSLRQLYYQMVTRNIIPNFQKSYNRLGTLIGNARMAGLIDWDMIKDRGRSTVQNAHWDSPAEVLYVVAEQFARNKWIDQPYHISVMVEKQALEGVLIPVCEELDISFTANKGYPSLSVLREYGNMLGDQARRLGKKIVVLYLGDHDPSGIDMTRDVQKRLSMFAEQDITLERLALNHEQVEALHLPPNPTKETDTRAAGYIEQFGGSCWELDAVEPAFLAQMIRDAVLRYRDADKWQKAVMVEKAMQEEIYEIADNYGEGAAEGE